MADYRLIFRNAATGERTSSLSHLGFRVWTQYQLSADDFGVCPALAAKLQGDNPALAEEPAKRIQAEIERLVAVRLCGVFEDGRRRYLYQSDWQDWQRLKHASSTTLPPIPAELLEKCSPKTRELFQEFHPKIREAFPPRARACDVPANASANADASSGGAGGAVVRVVTPARPATMRAPRVMPGSSVSWGRVHGSHTLGFCDWFCLPADVFGQLATRLGGEAEALAFAKRVRSRFESSVPKGVPSGRPWEFWERQLAIEFPPEAAPSRTPDALAGVREALRRV